MGDQKKSKPVTLAVPPAQRSDFLVSGSSSADLNCRTALLFPESAPLADQAVRGADRRAVTVKKRSDKTESTTLDLQAVWAHVTKPPTPEGAAVLIFLHGFYTFVTIDAAGACAWPSWADTDYAAQTDPKGTGPKCAAAGYGVIESVKHYKGSLIALAPENARPYVWKEVKEGKPPVYHGTIPAKAIFNQAGSLSKPDSLGKLVDECLQRLTKVKPPPDRPACPRSPLASVPKITRLFLTGHSGANRGLFEAAQAAITRQVPTDLVLLDCFYRNGSAQVQDFADNAQGGLGNGSGQSRIILVHDPSSYRPRVDQFPAMKAALKKKYKDKVAEVAFKTGKSGAETIRNAQAAARLAMTQSPIVTISGSLGHFSIPADFMPLVLETAK